MFDAMSDMPDVLTVPAQGDTLDAITQFRKNGCVDIDKLPDTQRNAVAYAVSRYKSGRVNREDCIQYLADVALITNNVADKMLSPLRKPAAFADKQTAALALPYVVGDSYTVGGKVCRLVSVNDWRWVKE